jgi:hypothetical protein
VRLGDDDEVAPSITSISRKRGKGNKKDKCKPNLMSRDAEVLK